MLAPDTNLRATPLSAHTGVAIEGVDLREPLNASTQSALNGAFLDHSVLVIRDQKLTAPEFMKAMENFGEMFPQHNSRFQVPECPMIHYVSNQDKYEDGTVYIPGEGHHTDHSNHPKPPKATALHAVKLPETGGDTQFTNMYEAYDALPDALKSKIEGRKARHVYQSKFSDRKLFELPDAKKKEVAEFVMHSLVRTHGETGRKALFINPIRIDHIEGMQDDEAMSLLDELLEHATTGKFEYRHKWRSGDVVIWDNRCLLHKANGDYPIDQVRYLYRLMLKGEAPVGAA
jgi:taurine dioxygenase